MDLGDLEERGITILADVCCLEDTRINIIDTPATPISAARWNVFSAWPTG